MRLDEVVLQQQRVHFCAGHRDLNIMNPGHQSHRFGCQPAGAKVATNTVAQVAGLTDVQQFPVCGIHLVNTRPGGQAL